MNLDRLKGSGDFLVWILVIVIALGFGKFGSTIGLNLGAADNYSDDKHSRRHRRDDFYPGPVRVVNFGPGKLGSLFGGNLLFILLVVALLFVCKDKKDEYSDKKNIDDNYEDDNYEEDNCEDDNFDYETKEKQD